MQTIPEQTVDRPGGSINRYSRIKGFTVVLGGILCLALCHIPIRGFSGPVPLPPSVTLSWNPSASSDVIGYRVYYGPGSGNYTNTVEAGSTMSITVPNLAKGGNYFFAVVAYTAQGVESSFSNEVNYTVPGGAARLQLRLTSNQQAVVTVMGISGHTFEIQATPDLKTWTTIGSVAVGANGTASYTNSNAGSFAKRFYRTRDTQP